MAAFLMHISDVMPQGPSKYIHGVRPSKTLQSKQLFPRAQKLFYATAGKRNHPVYSNNRQTIGICIVQTTLN
jgi:CRISPR/Cas system-associated protein Csx1